MRKREERVESAVAIRDVALKVIEENGQWRKLNRGPEIKLFEDERFSMVFYVRPRVSLELPRWCGSGPLRSGLYALELWHKTSGKVLNLAWDSVGARPQIVSFRRGEWEQELLRYSSPPRSQKAALSEKHNAETVRR
jgi:hypothetical protein